MIWLDEVVQERASTTKVAQPNFLSVVWLKSPISLRHLIMNQRESARCVILQKNQVGNVAPCEFDVGFIVAISLLCTSTTKI